jgi:hypothetical protein
MAEVMQKLRDDRRLKGAVIEQDSRVYVLQGTQEKPPQLQLLPSTSIPLLQLRPSTSIPLLQLRPSTSMPLLQQPSN